MRIRPQALLAALVIVLVAPLAVQAAEDPYGADPHRLVPFRDTVQQPYTSGTDVWEVWVCDVDNWNTSVDVASTVTSLNTLLNPYFSWLSGGDYETSFTAGGTVTSQDVITRQQIESLDQPFAGDCEAEVARASGSGPNGALIIVDIPFDVGYGTAGAVCPEPPFNGCGITYPNNARTAVLGAAAVTTVFPFAEPFWITVAHEIGHTLNWGHSFGGLTVDADTQSVSEYDNPMDTMSGAVHIGAPVGTIAYNRYAAGWIDPANVVIHTGGSAQYHLAPLGGGGLEMIVIPGDSEGHFYMFDARRKVSYDAKLPAAGVEAYEVDHRREIACTVPAHLPTEWPCFASLTRIKQTPAVNGFEGTDHVLGIDEQISVGGFTLKVLSAGASSFLVSIGEQDSGTFIDDDNNIHEPNIEAIAAVGITTGCNPPDNNRYCPTRSVTRAEMAAFLIRAMGLEDFLVPHQGTFPDVPAGEWYTPYVEALASAGVTTGYPDGTYRPEGLVSRAEMAVFLTRAFPSNPLVPAQGVFADVPVNSWYADEAEHLFSEGITEGCQASPLSYCPFDVVVRDQMASFLARALGIGN